MKKVLKPKEVEGVFSNTDKYRQTENNLAQKTSCVQFIIIFTVICVSGVLAMLSV
jgi:hypothetical protein